MLDEGLVTAGFGEATDYHAGARVSRESAEGTMRFTQQALRLLFEVPGELDRLRERPPELDATEADDDAPSSGQ